MQAFTEAAQCRPNTSQVPMPWTAVMMPASLTSSAPASLGSDTIASCTSIISCPALNIARHAAVVCLSWRFRFVPDLDPPAVAEGASKPCLIFASRPVSKGKRRAQESTTSRKASASVHISPNLPRGLLVLSFSMTPTRALMDARSAERNSEIFPKFGRACFSEVIASIGSHSTCKSSAPLSCAASSRASAEDPRNNGTDHEHLCLDCATAFLCGGTRSGLLPVRPAHLRWTLLLHCVHHASQCSSQAVRRR
eukprot:scaffold7436_cov258-Pinguiococcus_pyrenoidosus.AAC.5